MTQQTIDTSPNASPAHSIVVAHHVAKSFRSGSAATKVLTDVSFQVNEGDVLGIVGRSGVGKSTLLRLVGGLLATDDGHITVNELDPLEARARKTFGFMPQAPALLPWKSVIDNVALLGRINRSAQRPSMSSADALAAVGLSRVADAWPHQLSGGMRQRVALARVIATQAPVLLLDEPFSALDEITRDEMRAHIDSLRGVGKHTIIFVTHDITEAVLLADDVLVLHDEPGRVGGVFNTRGIGVAADAQPVVERLRNLLVVPS